LDDQVARKIFRPDLAPLFLPEADQGLVVLAHNDAGVGAADEVPPIESAICVNLLHSDPPRRLVTLMRYMRLDAVNTSFGII